MSASSDQFRTFECDACKLTLNGHSQYTMHLAGRKHLNKLKTRGEEAPVKGPQGYPDSTVSDPESKPLNKYGGNFVSASSSSKSENSNQSGQFGVSQGNSQGENYSSTNHYGSYSTGHFKPYASSGQYGDQYGGQYGTQNGNQYGGQYSSQNGAQHGWNYEGCQGGQYGGYSTGQYRGQQGRQYNEQYGQQHGYKGQNDYGQFNSQNYVTYPDIAVGKKPPAQETCDPVMKAVKANIMGKFPNKQGRFPKKRKAVMSERCDLCNVDYTSQSHKELHICGRKHARKVELSGDPEMKAVRANMLNKAPENTQKKKKPMMTERCELCSVDYTSPSHKEQHLSGKKHARKVETCGKDGVVDLEAMYCVTCELQLNSPFQYSQHILGSIHAKKEARKAKAENSAEEETTGPSPAKKQFVASSTTVESTTSEDN